MRSFWITRAERIVYGPEHQWTLLRALQNWLMSNLGKEPTISEELNTVVVQDEGLDLTPTSRRRELVSEKQLCLSLCPQKNYTYAEDKLLKDDANRTQNEINVKDGFSDYTRIHRVLCLRGPFLGGRVMGSYIVSRHFAPFKFTAVNCETLRKLGTPKRVRLKARKNTSKTFGEALQPRTVTSACTTIERAKHVLSTCGIGKHKAKTLQAKNILTVMIGSKRRNGFLFE